MSGMNAFTGRALAGVAHVEQSITQILTTPIGSRLMRRSFGSLVPELIDQPLHDETRLLIYAATATALRQWEPRFKLSRAELQVSDLSGRAELVLLGAVYLQGVWVMGESLNVVLKGG